MRIECVCLLGHTQGEFDELFWKTPLGRYITKADEETQREFFQRYLQDFIAMTMNVTCPEDLQVVFFIIPVQWFVHVLDVLIAHWPF